MVLNRQGTYIGPRKSITGPEPGEPGYNSKFKQGKSKAELGLPRNTPRFVVYQVIDKRDEDGKPTATHMMFQKEDTEYQAEQFAKAMGGDNDVVPGSVEVMTPKSLEKLKASGTEFSVMGGREKLFS